MVPQRRRQRGGRRRRCGGRREASGSRRGVRGCAIRPWHRRASAMGRASPAARAVLGGRERLRGDAPGAREGRIRGGGAGGRRAGKRERAVEEARPAIWKGKMQNRRLTLAGGGGRGGGGGGRRAGELEKAKERAAAEGVWRQSVVRHPRRRQWTSSRGAADSGVGEGLRGLGALAKAPAATASVGAGVGDGVGCGRRFWIFFFSVDWA